MLILKKKHVDNNQRDQINYIPILAPIAQSYYFIRQHVSIQCVMLGHWKQYTALEKQYTFACSSLMHATVVQLAQTQSSLFISSPSFPSQNQISCWNVGINKISQTKSYESKTNKESAICILQIISSTLFFRSGLLFMDTFMMVVTELSLHRPAIWQMK